MRYNDDDFYATPLDYETALRIWLMTSVMMTTWTAPGLRGIPHLMTTAPPLDFVGRLFASWDATLR